MDIGARLKEERLAKGLSLEELQEITKIQKRYLVASEEGKLEILPRKFYARAFIKEYAQALGIESSELLEEHKEEIPKVEDDDSVIQYSRMERSKNESNKGTNFFSVFPKIIVILLVVGIIFVLFYFIRTGMSDDEEITNPNGDNNSDSEIIINNPGEVSEEDTDEEVDQEDNNNTDVNESESTDKETREEDIEKEEGDDQVGEFTILEEGSGSSPESTLEFTYSGEEVIVVLESVEGRTWLDVKDANGKTYFSSNFSEENSPEEIDMSDAEQIYFNVGNVKALKISINGVELEYPVDTSKVHQRLWVQLNTQTD